MNTGTVPKAKIDPRALLSTLWIVVMINMMYADIMSLNIPGSADELARTSLSTGLSIPQLMLGGAVICELAILMIILSRVLRYGINRWANIGVSLFTIAFIWGGAAPYPHYFFIGTVETVCLILIVICAWKWRKGEA